MQVGILISAILGGLSTLFVLGANDAANSISSAVGSKALTLRGGLMLAAVGNLCGSALIGNNVSQTLATKIVTQSTIDPLTYTIGMLSALLATTATILAATLLNLPASSTHAVMGALITFGIFQKGSAGLDWAILGEITGTWIFTPLIGGMVSVFIWMMSGWILPIESHGERAPIRFAGLFGLVGTCIVTFVLVGGPDMLRLSGKVSSEAFVGIEMGVFAGMVCVGFVVEMMVVRNGGEEYYRIEQDETLRTQRQPDHCEHLSSDGQRSGAPTSNIELAPTPMSEMTIQSPQTTAATNPNRETTSSKLEIGDRYFIILMLCTCASMSFAHGGNDSANVLGPFIVIWEYETSSMAQWYLYVLGGVAIGVGLMTLGHRVVQTVGSKITHLESNYRVAFVAQFGASFTALVATVAGMPISTTTVIVGSISGVGWYTSRLDGQENEDVEWKLLAKILVTWSLTLPVASLFFTLFFLSLRAIFI